jgi:uncharacterized coiled-coil DUF342 family protein
MTWITNVLQWDNSALILYYVGMGLMLAAIGAVIYLYAYYNKMLSKLPDAVRFKSLQARINTLEGKRDDLDKEVDELKQWLAEHSRAIEEAQKAQKWMEENKLTIPQLENEITAKRNEYDKLSKMLHEEGEKLQKLREDMQTSEQLLAEMRIETKTSEQQQQLYQKQVTELTEKSERLTNEIKKMQSDAQTAKLDYEKAEKNLKETLTSLTKAEAALEEKLKKLEELNGKVATAEGKAKALDVQIDALEEATNKLSTSIESISPPDLKTRLEDLYRPVITESSKLANKLDDEDTWLTRFHNDLKSGGVIFPERTIRAFHTSLKIADISPMVVLAGISGTGKSMLPQLYSEAIGMTFLPISVQPRWDGPQDLFGFYNYMENRFKATELSRLLWQYDRYNNDHGDFNIHNGMSLVLLDEMNLARVEYYFSDMLSKLELRRNIDPDDFEKRSIAEIEIESGPLKKNEKNTRLFVGNNILFVGTMNEDETTQSLSDKVIDRSNMLRFGKPAETKEKPDVQKIIKDIQVPRVSKSAWQAWQKNDLPKTQQQTLDVYIETINQSMSLVGKPFGHRISQAVNAYVANYPEAISNKAAFNNAIADQIEMKLLPKLNGLEQSAENVDKLYADVKDIVNELGDIQLLEALEAATDSSKPFFEWQGISR